MRNLLNFFSRPRTVAIQFYNCKQLTVNLIHSGTDLNTEDLKNIVPLLHRIPCEQAGLFAVTDLWKKHRDSDEKENRQAQYFSFHEDCEKMSRKLKITDIPADFRALSEPIAEKLQKTGDLYKKIAESGRFPGTEELDKIIGSFASDDDLYEKSVALSRKYRLSVTTESC